MIEGPEYGVNLVQEHSRWSNIFQELRGKVTLEICAGGACRNRIFEISAADVIEWSVRIAELMAEQATTAKVPIGAGGGTPPDGYTPTHTGPMMLEPEVANQDTLGDTVDAYVYTPVPDPDDV